MTDLHEVIQARPGADHGVPVDPRSIVVLAPTSTSSPTTTRPSCGTEESRGGGEAESFLADPGARIDVHPGTDDRMAETGMGANPAVGGPDRPRPRQWRRRDRCGEQAPTFCPGLNQGREGPTSREEGSTCAPSATNAVGSEPPGARAAPGGTGRLPAPSPRRAPS